jgi:hypothetical protein
MQAAKPAESRRATIGGEAPDATNAPTGYYQGAHHTRLRSTPLWKRIEKPQAVTTSKAV